MTKTHASRSTPTASATGALALGAHDKGALATGALDNGAAIRILFIGNSFTARNDLPGLIVEMAASAPEPITVTTDQVLANGASLRQHWNQGIAVQKMRARHWDFVVLQEQSTLPLKNAERYHENVRLFAAAIQPSAIQPSVIQQPVIPQEARIPTTRTVLYLTWARQQVPETQTALTAATTAIAEEIRGLVVPVGVAWQEASTQQPPLALYDRDGSHPSAAGSYLAACVFYATLFGQSPAGLAVPERLQLSPSLALAVQKAAWTTSIRWSRKPC